MFDKGFWRKLVPPVGLSAYPNLPCPYCGHFSLGVDIESVQYRHVTIDERTTAFLMSTVPSIPGIDGLDKDNGLRFLFGLSSTMQAMKYEPAKFICFFQCVSCYGSVSAAGTAAIPKKADFGDDTKIKVEHFSPPIPLFPLHSSVPAAVSSELINAFSHFHSDILSSGAKLRRATEQFCNVLGFVDGSLHHRIEQMVAVYPQEAEWLRSLKLVGNEATHSLGVEAADLLSSFEIFAELTDFLVRRSRQKAVSQTAQSITEKFKKK